MICDLAQYYNIYNYEQLAFNKLAVFVFGLPDDSRIMKKLSGLKVDLNTVMTAGVLDRLSMILYSLAGSKGSKKPETLTSILLGNKKTKEKKPNGYVSGKEFEKRRQEILKRIGENNGK
ncbi:hypothetical protein [Anaerococcus hydrogenalis]|uniref:Uncharacterized protein n=1 Tax=Anaerococcus hydrogenalis ACS-025-V-Sch4 TaxID=879306 RepID=F0H1N3_9FIRM|nr:hypothetical protein [Anaerococcus hydrogenalis]EGC83656.1 hypothetical protein HMPREF9246_1237 [Anaerococcus hydrogenalis ACS-025-V-Sch4]